MTPTLTHPDQKWMLELEQRAAAAVDEERIKRFLAKLPPPPEPVPRLQLFGLALASALIGALAASCLLLTFLSHY